MRVVHSAMTGVNNMLLRKKNLFTVLILTYVGYILDIKFNIFKKVQVLKGSLKNPTHLHSSVRCAIP